jgi:S1-C subfamily serine protease
MIDNHNLPEEEPVSLAWQRFVEFLLGLLLLAGSLFMVHHYLPQPTNNLNDQVRQLSQQLDQLRQEQSMPVTVLNRYRDSICFVFGVYQVGFPNQRPSLRARISGTGFVVTEGLLATNRHVAEPWYGDTEAEGLIRQGAKPELQRLVAFFPGFSTPVVVTPAALSVQGDLAILKVHDSQAVNKLRPLPLAEQPSDPGELVAVVGYPMGVLGMVAKSPAPVYERLAYRRDDIGAANELAALSLIRPSATCGHLGDVVGDKLIYDATTAHGASGGPVFNSRGQVIGVNAAYIDGFSGGTLGVSVSALRPLILAAQRKSMIKNASSRD